MNSDRFDPTLLENNRSPKNSELSRNDLNIHVKSLDKAKKMSVDNSKKHRYQKSSMDRLL